MAVLRIGRRKQRKMDKFVVSPSFYRMLHHPNQVFVQQRFSPIKADAANIKTLAVIKKVSHDGPRQLFSRHKITAITAALTTQVTICGQGDKNFPRIRLNKLGKNRSGGMTY